MRRSSDNAGAGTPHPYDGHPRESEQSPVVAVSYKRIKGLLSRRSQDQCPHVHQMSNASA